MRESFARPHVAILNNCLLPYCSRTKRSCIIITPTKHLTVIQHGCVQQEKNSNLATLRLFFSKETNFLCDNNFPYLYTCRNFIITHCYDSYYYSFPLLQSLKLVSPTLHTFLLFYANFTNEGRGRKGALASRPIHLTGFAVVFLPAQHLFLRRLVPPLAQRLRHARREKNKHTLMFALFQSLTWRTQIHILIRTT